MGGFQIRLCFLLKYQERNNFSQGSSQATRFKFIFCLGLFNHFLFLFLSCDFAGFHKPRLLFVPTVNKFDNNNTKETFKTSNHSNILRRKLLRYRLDISVMVFLTYFQRFFGVFRGCRMGILERNGLMLFIKLEICLVLFTVKTLLFKK